MTSAHRHLCVSLGPRTQASCERITENVCAVCDVMEMCVSQSINQSWFKGRVERIFFFASFKLPLFNEYEMVFIIA